jgi:hypothetical protein
MPMRTSASTKTPNSQFCLINHYESRRKQKKQFFQQYNFISLLIRANKTLGNLYLQSINKKNRQNKLILYKLSKAGRNGFEADMEIYSKYFNTGKKITQYKKCKSQEIMRLGKKSPEDSIKEYVEA